MGNNQSTSWLMPLRCTLDNWKISDSLTLGRSHLKFFYATAWPWYPLEDKEHCPEDGSLNYNTILQLELFCKRQEKCTEIPYVQIFSWLRIIKKAREFQKTSISALLTMPKPLTVWITIHCGNSERDGNTRLPDLSLEKPVCRSGSNS